MKEGKCKFSKYALWTEAIRSPTLFPYVAGLGKYRHYTYFLRKSIRPRDRCIFSPTLCYHGTIWSWPCSSHGVNPNTPVAEGALTGRAITRISTTWRQSDMKYSIRVTNRCRVSTWSHDLRILVGLTANQLRVWRRLKVAWSALASTDHFALNTDTPGKTARNISDAVLPVGTV